jgi:hypothetical protein
MLCVNDATRRAARPGVGRQADRTRSSGVPASPSHRTIAVSGPVSAAPAAASTPERDSTLVSRSSRPATRARALGLVGAQFPFNLQYLGAGLLADRNRQLKTVDRGRNARAADLASATDEMPC